MAPVYKFRGVGETSTFTTITEYFRLYTLDVATNAEEGSVAQSTIRAQDPSGAFDIVGHRQVRIYEDTATGSNTTIYAGYTGGRRISRGDYRTTTARVWDIDLVDLNSVLARRVMNGSDCNRPAETDVARLQWLLTTGEAVLISDDLYLNTSGAVQMDAVDYRGQRLSDIINDCAQASGKNYFVWFREETDEFSLWYDFASSTSYSSPIRLTNVLSEVDSAWTFAISPDTELSRSPDRVNSGVYLPYDGGAIYLQTFTTANAFARRDAVMPAENVKSLAKATARATRYLGEMNTEEDVITTTVTLPAAKVNFLMQGMRVQFRATHLPGYEGFVWARALNRSVFQVSEEFYEVKLELSVAPAVCSIAFVQEADGGPEGGVSTTFARADLPSAPTPGNLLVAWCTHRANDGTVVPTGFTAVTPGYVSIPTEDDGTPSATEIHRGRLYYRVAQTGDSATVLAALTGTTAGSHLFVAEFSGCDSWTLDDFDSATDNTDVPGPAPITLGGGTVTPTGGPALVVGGYGSGSGDNDPFGTWTPSAGVTLIAAEKTGFSGAPFAAFVYQIVDDPSGSYAPTVVNVGPNTRGTGGCVAAFRTS